MTDRGHSKYYPKYTLYSSATQSYPIQRKMIFSFLRPSVTPELPPPHNVAVLEPCHAMKRKIPSLRVAAQRAVGAHACNAEVTFAKKDGELSTASRLLRSFHERENGERTCVLLLVCALSIPWASTTHSFSLSLLSFRFIIATNNEISLYRSRIDS